MRLGRNALGVLASAGLILLTTAHGQTAASCLGDHCDELEQAACEDAGGDYHGVLS